MAWICWDGLSWTCEIKYADTHHWTASVWTALFRKPLSMLTSVCIYVCFMSGLCRLLGFAAAYIYIVFSGTFFRHCGRPNPPPSVCGSGVLSWKHENWHIQVEMFRLSLSAIFMSSLYNLLKKCMCLSASWKMTRWLEPKCHVQVCLSEMSVLLSCIPVKLFLKRKFCMSHHK